MSCLKTEKLLLKSLGHLSDIERKIIYLHYWVPMDIEEISRDLHISKSRAIDVLENAVLKLRKDFNKAGFRIEVSKPASFWTKTNKGHNNGFIFK